MCILVLRCLQSFKAFLNALLEDPILSYFALLCFTDTMLFFFFFLKDVFLHVNKNYGKSGGGGRVVLRLESTVFLNTVETLSWNHFTTLAWLCWLPNN